MKRNLKVKAITEPTCSSDGYRVFIERKWPHGSSIDANLVDYWAAELAPSFALETWYSDNTGQWCKFRHWYLAELRDRFEDVMDLYRHIGNNEIVTLIHDGADQIRNNAVVLAAYLILEPYFSLLRG